MVQFIAIGGGGGGGGYTPGVTPHDNLVQTNEDTPTSFNVLSDDTGDGPLFVFSAVSDGVEWQLGTDNTLGSLGSVTINVDGSGTINPAAQQHGTAFAYYAVSNGRDLRVGKITFTVISVNDPPTVRGVSKVSPQGAPVTVNLIAAGIDPDGDILTVTRVNGSAPVPETPISLTGGTLTYHSNGTATIAPSISSGEITSTFRLADPSGLFADGAITITVGVENKPLHSPIVPLSPGVPADDAWLRRAPCFFQETWPGLGNVAGWPNIGPGNTPIDPNLYTVDRGFFLLDVNREPWLYNKPELAYLYYKRGGPDFLFARQVFKTWTEKYFANVVFEQDGVTAGFGVEGANTDVKYFYPWLAYLYAQEFGDTGFYAKADGLYRGALKYWPFTQPGAPLWTERGAWAAIKCCVDKYIRSGGLDQDALANALTYWHGVQAISGSGAPLHPHGQHEGDASTTPISSPWMAALLAESLIQLMRLLDPALYATDIEGIKRWIYNCSKWHAERVYFVASIDEPEFAFPAPGIQGKHLFGYLVANGGPTDKGQEDDIAHGADIRAFLRKGIRCGQDLSADTTLLQTIADEQVQVAATDLEYWSNRTTLGLPGGPFVARDAPARKPAWQQVCDSSDDVIYLSDGTAGNITIIPIAPTMLSAPTLTGSTQQGATIALDRGTWGGVPAPTLSSTFENDEVAIGGTTDTTFVTRSQDVGHDVSGYVTATNTGGVAHARSNKLHIVLAGTPIITSSPTASSVGAGGTASFSATWTGSPTPTFQWEESTDGGLSAHDVTDGSGGSGTGLSSTFTRTANSGDNARLYRVRVTNVGGTVYSAYALLAIVAQQPAMRLNGSTAGAYIAHQFGGNGFTGMRWGSLIYIETPANSASTVDALGVAGRYGVIGYNNSSLFAIGDSSSLTPFDENLPTGEWIYIDVHWPTTAPSGTVTASWRRLTGDVTVRTKTHVNAIEDSIPMTFFSVNGGASSAHGTGTGCVMRATYIRVLEGAAAEATTVDAEVTRTSAADCSMFIVAQNDGVGGVSVIDKSGHSLLMTLVNATLETDGPVVPGVT